MVLEAQDNTSFLHPQYRVPNKLPEECFRAYDIRGPVNPEQITPDLTYAIGMAIGSEARERGESTLVVGRDGRLSGPLLIDPLIQGLRATGIHVVFIGVVPTPVVYFVTHSTATRSGVMLTASHNPKDHNGFKIILGGKTLNQEEIKKLYQRIKKKSFVSGQGTFTEKNYTDEYIQYICDHIQLARPLKIVIDCGNGAGSEIAPKVYERLGCEVIPLYCEMDGNFPNHHPDPTIPENLNDVIQAVHATKADVGFALDGDADRLGVVSSTGEIIWPDRQMMLYSAEVLKKHPGAEIIFDVKCSANLAKTIVAHGGKPVMWRTGHSVIKAKLFDSGSPFAGELSGHLFFKDEWFGFDDGIYAGARLLRILAQEKRTPAEIFASLPNDVNTPELKLAMPEQRKFAFMQRLIQEAEFPDAHKVFIDGIRIEYPEGWALIRASNTSPYLILRFEAKNALVLAQIQQKVGEQLLKLDPHLTLPY